MKYIVLIIHLFVLTSCSNLSFKSLEKEKSSIRFDHDVSLTVSGRKLDVKAGEEIELIKDKPILAEARGRVAMFIYPVDSRDDELKVSLPTLNKSQITSVQEQNINVQLDELLPEIQQVQVMMLKRDYTNALSKIRDLKTKNPGVAFLSFIEGSCYSVLNRKSEAIRAIREGLSIYPESPDAKELYKKLSGENY